jgi:predicted AAA+ superfamily ATPase
LWRHWRSGRWGWTVLAIVCPSEKTISGAKSEHHSRGGSVERSRHLGNPGEFAQACRSLPANKKGQFVFVDEAQSVPSIFDAVQALYDADKSRWRFVLCGSSARKLRLTGANLRPGRSLVHHLYPLTLAELPANEAKIPHATSPLPFPWSHGKQAKHPFPGWDLLTRLSYGALPGIVTADK